MAINIRFRAGALFCAALAAGSAWALKSDKNQPINIQADHADFRGDNKTNNGTGVYTGHVVITQGSMTLASDKAVLHLVNGELQSADATGKPAAFDQQPDNGEHVHSVAQEIIYDAVKNQVDLIGDAHLTQGTRVMSADRIHYDTQTSHVDAKGAVDGDRVHLVIPPKQPAPAAGTTAPAKTPPKTGTPPP
jgi:lipopolysaccharide export system protein LptA